MIKLLTLFLTLSVANAQTLSYLLPDQKGLFEHALSTHLKKANKEIVILTPTLKYAALRTQLIRSSSKGIIVTLISQNPADDPLGLIAYRGIGLYLYSARPLADSLIVIDNTMVCHLSGGLNDEELAPTTQSVLCSDDPDLISTMQHNVRQIIKRSKPYLK